MTITPSHKLKSHFELKWNPFLPSLPNESLYGDGDLELFFWRVEQIASEGGFAMVTGDSGTGKSCTLRVIRDKLAKNPNTSVCLIDRPQSRIRDFYREMATLYGIPLQVTNRYGSFQRLREQWLALTNSHAFRPVLIIDEAQEMHEETLAELRILGSTDLDARCILSVVFAGDRRLAAKLESPTLLPLKSRIRARIDLGNRDATEMRALLDHLLNEAGNPHIMTEPVKKALADQCANNSRVLATLGQELLLHAYIKGKKVVDEELYFDLHRGNSKKRRS